MYCLWDGSFIANGHALIPIDLENTENETLKYLLKYLEDELIFYPPSLPKGRFPSLSELRQAIHSLDYKLDEAQDWDVTSDDNFVEIWFGGEKHEDKPTEFWFRRGSLIVLDIAQALARTCASLAIAEHSGAAAVVVVPDDLFPDSSTDQTNGGYIAAILRRLPEINGRLTKAPLEEALFLLSQVVQALKRLDRFRQYEFFEKARQALPVCRTMLNHEDVRVRYLAFEVVSAFRENFYQDAALIGQSLRAEINADCKGQMIRRLETLLVPGSVGPSVDPSRALLLEILEAISEGAAESDPVRLAVAYLLTRAQPGFMTPSMRLIFVEVLPSQRAILEMVIDLDIP